MPTKRSRRLPLCPLLAAAALWGVFGAGAAAPSASVSRPGGQSAWASLEVRGVWMHPRFFGTERGPALEKIRATLDRYAAAGIDSLFMLVKDTSGHVYYRSGTGVPDPAYDWDFFGAFLDEARARRMTVHPWFCVFPEGGLLGEVRAHPEWLIAGRGGELVRTVNPALPEVRAYEVGLMAELAARYPVDWIHLDYIRFPCEPEEPYFSYDARTRELCKAETGVDPLALKARDSGNPFWNAWLEWNRDQVTRFVAELRTALRAAGRPVRISAAVFPDPANAAVLIGQDWVRWAAEGLVDMLCPMLYTNDAALFEALARRATALGRGGGRTGGLLVCPGIGIGTSHNQATPEIMAAEVGVSRSLGADGVVFFSSSSLTEPFLKALEDARRR
ncbi:MAG: family 10 glycosylhydrolase [Candidatus Aminicenantes bacterium]|nr:family 10 glycosylhydrolase [Candidatus Aminicenantes bacterium]